MVVVAPEENTPGGKGLSQTGNSEQEWNGSDIGLAKTRPYLEMVNVSKDETGTIWSVVCETGANIY